MGLQMTLEPEMAAAAHPRRADQELDLLDALRQREPTAADASIQAELRMALTAAIDELPPAYRTVLVLRDVQGLSNAEIAKLAGLSVCVVKTRVHRARLFLRKKLGDAMTTLDSTTAARGDS